jgi:hypothetical protein
MPYVFVSAWESRRLRLEKPQQRDSVVENDTKGVRPLVYVVIHTDFPYEPLMIGAGYYPPPQQAGTAQQVRPQVLRSMLRLGSCFLPGNFVCLPPNI